MKLDGFALSEALVALAVGSLAIGGLALLNVDLVRLSGRIDAASKRGGTLEAVRRASGLASDPCTPEVRAITIGADGIAGLASDSAPTLTIKLREPRSVGVMRTRGLERTIAMPAGPRLRAHGVTGADGENVEGLSAGFIDLPDGGGVTLGLRCDLPEQCRYDSVGGACRDEE